MQYRPRIGTPVVQDHHLKIFDPELLTFPAFGTADFPGSVGLDSKVNSNNPVHSA
jgi:hypothetical protein